MATVPLCHDRGIRTRGTEPECNREMQFPDSIAENFIAVVLTVGTSLTLHKLPARQLPLRNPACLNTFRKNRTHPSIASEARPRASYDMPERVRQDVQTQSHRIHSTYCCSKYILKLGRFHSHLLKYTVLNEPCNVPR